MPVRLLVVFVLASCSGATEPPTDVVVSDDVAEDVSDDVAEDVTGEDVSDDVAEDGSDAPETGSFADVVGVTTRGTSSVTFSVRIASPDTGCDQYADWWEVLDEDGALLTRRVLGHSHVDEQPFTRSGSSVDIVDDEARLFVRAHMHPTGFGGQVFSGNVAGGFSRDLSPPSFPASLETSPPQPSACAF